MASLLRLRTMLSHVAQRSLPPYGTAVQPSNYGSYLKAHNQILHQARCASTALGGSVQGTGPALSIQPESGLCDEMLDIQARGLEPGQLVTLRAQVHTENGRYRFLSYAKYKASADGTVKAQRDVSLGGSYEGVHPMGLLWGMKPAPEVEHKHPRLVKWDATEPFKYTFELLEGEVAVDGEGKVLDSKMIERRYLADYVEQIPVSMGCADGILFLPKQRGQSDPLPLVIDIRGLLTRIVVDRAATLASHGFAVFAFDYFLPRRLKTTDRVVYMDAQAFLDIFEYAKEHPRLDATRIGMTSSCYGGSMMLHAATRLDLPVKCLVAAGFTDVLSVEVGWRNLDGSLLEPLGPMESIIDRWQDEKGSWWISFTKKMGEDAMTYAGSVHSSLEENMNCPFLMFGHGDDKHIPSLLTTAYLLHRLKEAGKGHLVDYHLLPGSGHFLEVPFQSINTASSLFDPTSIGTEQKMYYTRYGGDDTTQAGLDQEFAWRKIINFFRKHLEVKEMYRTDWISD